MAVATERKTAEERRESILEAALIEFAEHGAAGMSTESIARRDGISQPYIFRLFGAEKALTIATVDRCLRGTLQMFRTAAAGLSGEEVFKAISEADSQLLSDALCLRNLV